MDEDQNKRVSVCVCMCVSSCQDGLVFYVQSGSLSSFFMEGVCCTLILTDLGESSLRLKIQCQADSGKGNYYI